ncbi:CBS domain-containing protein [Halovenus sp. WSH3]|uniref:Zinc metalloprotease n=1 Tax=Halovenus carboxidivorans TaxID=2692199 RepID=A0A6B0SWH5_9EURY|nr:site-2 protease family protein [Halovenus carboxidivorans]MXR50038.1 CBS domain-containing protein [Halovenus carboxidivorans]
MSKYNYTIFRVWGIPIRINISLLVFLPILAFLIGSGEQIEAYSRVITGLTPATVDPAALSGPEDRWLIGTVSAVALFGSVTFHELGHAWAAMHYEIEVESITLWLLGGLASLSSMPDEWDREFWIAIAGPASSLLLAGAALAVLVVLPESAVLPVYCVGFLAVMNVFLAAFNMLPAFPMDGGRVLRALLARNRSYVSATRTAASVGTIFALLFLGVGIITFSPLLLILALFVHVAATNESRSVVIAGLLSDLTVADLVSDQEPLPADTTVEAALDRLFASRRSELPVVDGDGDIVGVVTTGELRSVPTDRFATTAVGSVATDEVPRIDGRAAAVDGLYELIGSDSPVALVEWDGRPIGLISRPDFTSALNMRRETGAF